MKLKHYIKKAIKMPPDVLFKKIWRKLSDKIDSGLRRLVDFHSDTRSKNGAGVVIGSSFVTAAGADVSRIDERAAGYISGMYMSHRFDLLGSGWIDYAYGAGANGVEGIKYAADLAVSSIDSDGNWLEGVVLRAHLESSKKIWRRVKNADSVYRPIDWQKDSKSGYRWSAKKYYKEQRIGCCPGADIKMPWELSRLQHLPQLALFAIRLSGRAGYKEKLIIEFMNQVADFAAANPPRMGANWTCTMDVGIRAANLLIAYDLFRGIDDKKIIDEDFKRFFSGFIYEHGLHIVNNLEYSEFLTSNHYLSDIAGLLFIASYLETTAETSAWLAFAIQEFVSEMKKQFNEDGSNFEASTSYHRLSGEIAVYCAALITGLKERHIEALKTYQCGLWKFKPKLRPLADQEYKIKGGSVELPRWLIERLYRAGLFTLDISKPSGEIPQIGDNDSGRFFRLSPAGRFMTTGTAAAKYKNLKNCIVAGCSEEEYWDENILDHATFISAVAGLFDDEKFSPAAERYPLEKSIVGMLAGGRKLPAVQRNVTGQLNGGKEFYGSYPDAGKIFYGRDELKYIKTTVVYKDLANRSSSLTNNLKNIIYKNFGIYLFKSDRLYLAVFAGPNGQNGNGGHGHNDKLSFELSIDGKDLIVDAGTYFYTPLPERRNQFRSVRAHSVPIHCGREQNEWLPGTDGLFSMTDSTKCELLHFSTNNLTIKLSYDKIIHVRSFFVAHDEVRIEDRSNSDFEFNINDFKLYSNGYGKLING
ncbi:MAG TPA: heparinase II/III family protein [Candidatus Wallbacteria bacterium]|nr:heparinase II/III family protein [Candidatus Wallbacteria bacterium]